MHSLLHVYMNYIVTKMKRGPVDQRKWRQTTGGLGDWASRSDLRRAIRSVRFVTFNCCWPGRLLHAASMHLPMQLCLCQDWTL